MTRKCGCSGQCGPANRRSLAARVHRAGGDRHGRCGPRRAIGRSGGKPEHSGPKISRSGNKPFSVRHLREFMIPAPTSMPGCIWEASAQATSRSGPTASSPPGSSSTPCATARCRSISWPAPARPRGCCRPGADRTGPESQQISMTGEYPIATLRYTDPELPVKIELDAFSPFAPLDTRLSSIPAAVFVFRIHNPTDRAEEVALAATPDEPGRL